MFGRLTSLVSLISGLVIALRLHGRVITLGMIILLWWQLWWCDEVGVVKRFCLVHKWCEIWQNITTWPWQYLWIWFDSFLSESSDLS
jgi:hypothetical protein